MPTKLTELCLTALCRAMVCYVINDDTESKAKIKGEIIQFIFKVGIYISISTYTLYLDDKCAR